MESVATTVMVATPNRFGIGTYRDAHQQGKVGEAGQCRT